MVKESLDAFVARDTALARQVCGENSEVDARPTGRGARSIDNGRCGWKRGRYDARLAERRYKAIDPDHRVVARTLEREWNDSSNTWNLEGVYIADATPWATVATLHHLLCGSANGVGVAHRRIDLPWGTRHHLCRVEEATRDEPSNHPRPDAEPIGRLVQREHGRRRGLVKWPSDRTGVPLLAANAWR